MVPLIPLDTIQVDIYVNNQALQQYNDDKQEEAPDSVTKYVEATSGANFEVRCTFADRFHNRHDLSVKLYVDGKFIDGHTFFRRDIELGKVCTFDGMRESIGKKFFLRKMRFSELHIDDGSAQTIDDRLKRRLENIGAITIKFFWVVISSVFSSKTSRAVTEPIGSMPEKALKGKTLSHQASLAERETGKSFSMVHTSRLYDNKPAATYNLKYRSKDALKSLMIIPRTPSPVPFEQRDLDGLSFDEMREIIRRQRERNDAGKSIKNERGIKRERLTDGSNNAGEMMDNGEVSFISEKKRRVTSTPQDGAEIVDLT
ncbi:hypothetical protein BS50DRAFT_632589 [Corynespora cassiicola Philippines]|uniref:DUF7918 domain-containing protein n=1 Tax=Corynespora cassiicola Philippines TaxID=1448308 RepID=A0A2T2NTC9_CORCC|nr:hypothetical protein BS50DRAFT_632589 [Corynespora cassiicola Philippines]